MITAKQVKELRDLTGAGMLDCKKALEETNGDIEQAVIYLREKGIAKAAKKGARIAAEGLTNGIVEGNKAVLYEVNSETDFVSKNEQFLNLIDTVGTVLFNNTVNSDEEALKLESNGESLETVLANATATIGEKITLRRVKTIIKEDNQTFGFYKHMGGKISALALVVGDEEVAKNIAMHVAAQNPKYLTQDEIEQSVIEQERSILLNQALEENKTAEKPKPENIIEKMVEGRLNKELKEVCLVNQAYVKDPNISVSEYLKQNKASVKLFVRLEVGEGIEKRKEDFAAEVQAQIKG
ncbi:MAG: translation elongation factor Ts [Acholeplasmataceae bacterium]|nr:translation elongation factor Ts [Acholeplasmataceae bacterium]MDD4204416.1 translation elongation factor Ts [Acholeplasmataceae bacterium]MDD4468345.1 translation elongation factor Ts [Acholeplasmataceae bacterium]MDD4823637.1 translation elongation factor Ts [Acholeplasmataceae bacterium]